VTPATDTPTRDARLEAVRGAGLLLLFALHGADVRLGTALLLAQVAAVLAAAIVAGRVFGRTLDRHGLAACIGRTAYRAAQYGLAFAGAGLALLTLRSLGALDEFALASWQAAPGGPVHVLLPLPGDALLYQWRECLMLRVGPVPLQLLALCAWLLLATPALLWLMKHLPPLVPAVAALLWATLSPAPAWTSAPFELPHPIDRWIAVWMCGLLIGTRWDAWSRLAPLPRLALAAVLAAAGFAQLTDVPELSALCVAASVTLAAHACLAAWGGAERHPVVSRLRLPAQWPVLAWSGHGAALLLLAVLAPRSPSLLWTANLIGLGLVVALGWAAERRQARRAQPSCTVSSRVLV
jgi:hypothetical protein